MLFLAFTGKLDMTKLLFFCTSFQQNGITSQDINLKLCTAPVLSWRLDSRSVFERIAEALMKLC